MQVMMVAKSVAAFRIVPSVCLNVWEAFDCFGNTVVHFNPHCKWRHSRRVGILSAKTKRICIRKNPHQSPDCECLMVVLERDPV
jgi:hypothetical protein